MMTCRATGRVLNQAGAGGVLIAALLCLPFESQAAKSAPLAASVPRIPSFSALTQDRSRTCAPEHSATEAPPGWRQVSLTCAWRGLLQVRRWEINPNGGPSSCAGKPAQWWAWSRKRLNVAPSSGGAAWHVSWPFQSMAGAVGPARRIAIVEAGQGTALVATEWTWTPSSRHDTRVWQEGRWKILEVAAASMRAATPNGLPAHVGQLRNAWEKNLNGRAGEIGADGWLWQGDGVCMRMIIPEPGAALRLPYAREDARVEQRAAMQIQLARRYPDASWLIPFRLLPVPAAGAASGAKYAAVWSENGILTGQLWMPAKDDSMTVRTRILVKLAANADGESVARAVDRELGGIASIWSAQHER